MSSNGSMRASRAEKNEQAFKSYNERRAAFEDKSGVPPDEPVPFVCECDDPACSQAIQLPLAEYEHAVEPIARFIVVPGHEDLAIEDVVEEHDAYFVVSKPGLRRRSEPPPGG